MVGPESEPHDLRAAAEVYTRVRPRLFGIAYRMLGSVSDAEDILQDVWLRWQSADRSAVRDPVAYLVTTTTRTCINELQSARVRRESYVGPWLPEPIDTSADPALGAERAAGLHMVTLMLLEKLTPPERAAYILREAFDYPYELISRTIDVGEANARQLVSRARKHLAVDRREPVDTAAQQRLLTAFISAARSGQMAALEAVLADDVSSYTDGNGVRNASRVPVHGRTTVARFVRSFAHHFWVDTSVTWLEANGRPSALIDRGGTPIAFLTVEASEHGIDQVLWVMNPDKLARLH
ncbi:RNA polymerase sigma-70 factor [Mycolicibacterium sediminis]|uniref:RNA polymerase sigma24 factor n=1 Tax=Mycolicibacterium sediminis TaxID=1286180 RepID=A0A7I7QL94_9MYCO|nr:RNA polymerase sigma-70 factor [Mycolicibacterium sediminis]BBY26747.1 RNA polymerase sigma24 factor [Mycolicibacterium sediminis]